MQPPLPHHPHPHVNGQPPQVPMPNTRPPPPPTHCHAPQAPSTRQPLSQSPQPLSPPPQAAQVPHRAPPPHAPPSGTPPHALVEGAKPPAPPQRLDPKSLERASGLLANEQEKRGKLHQQYRSSYEHVCHHLLWHLDQQRGLAEAVLGFVKQRQAVDMQYAASLQKLPPIAIASGTPAGLRAAFAAVSDMPSKTATSYQQNADAMAQGPVKKLAQLVAEMEAGTRAIRVQVSKALARASAGFQELQGLMAALHKGMAGALHMEDPYLLALKIKRSILSTSDEEKEIADAVCTLLQDVRRIHSRNIEGLKLIMRWSRVGLGWAALGVLFYLFTWLGLVCFGLVLVCLGLDWAGLVWFGVIQLRFGWFGFDLI